MHLLILNDSIAFKKNGTYFSLDTFSQLVLQLQPWFKRISYCLQVHSVEGAGPKLPRVPLGDKKSIEIVESAPYGGEIGFYKRFPYILLRNTPRFIRALRQADVVLLRFPSQNAFYLSLLCRFFHKPYVCALIGDQRVLILAGSKYKGLRRKIAVAAAGFNEFLLRRVLRFAGACFFYSKDLLEKFGKLNPDSHLLFESPIREQDIVVRVPPPDVDRRSPWLLTVGRLAHEKRIDDIIAATVVLRENGIHARLRICGDGPERSKLEHLVKQWGVEEQVEFLGFVPWGDPLDAEYVGSDCLILASVSEGVPKVLIEALSKGVPVIATAVGGVPDVISHMNNGILVPPLAPNAIADAVKLLLFDDGLRHRIVENGYAYVRVHTAEKIAAEMSRIIIECVHRNANPRL